MPFQKGNTLADVSKQGNGGARPGAGRKPKKSWAQLYAEQPNGTGTMLATIPHELGRWIEEQAAKEEEPTSPAQMLVRLAQRARIAELIVE